MGLLSRLNGRFQWVCLVVVVDVVVCSFVVVVAVVVAAAVVVVLVAVEKGQLHPNCEQNDILAHKDKIPPNGRSCTNRSCTWDVL